jgi:hypothetical protein
MRLHGVCRRCRLKLPPMLDSMGSEYLGQSMNGASTVHDGDQFLTCHGSPTVRAACAVLDTAKSVYGILQYEIMQKV